MRATFKLLNSYFWKTFYGPILAFIFPVILLLILGNIFKVEYVYPGIIAMSFLFIGLLSLPLAIMELKQSSLFKYIGSSPVNPIRFSLTVILFYIIVAFVTTLIILAVTVAAFWHQVVPGATYTAAHVLVSAGGFSNGILGGIFSTIAGGMSFIAATLVHLLFVIVFGLFIATLSKTPQQSLTSGLIILIPSMFLSGMIISVDIIGQAPVLNWISRLIPFRYTTGNLIIATTPPPQIGDMLSSLPSNQLSLIFSNVVDGVVTVSGPNQTYHIHNMNELASFMKNTYESGTMDVIKDQTLYNLTFGVALHVGATQSDNNIFNWVDSWSVRRVPEVSSIKGFITNYFGSFNSAGGAIDWSKLTPIATQIQNHDYGWLDIFMKQTNVLYAKADRVLNLMLPISLSALMLWYTGTHFKWSAR